MDRFRNFLSKTTAGTVIAYMWTVASVLMFFGVGDVSDQNMEKVYSIDMVLIGYFFTRKPEKGEDADVQITTETKQTTVSTSPTTPTTPA